jgi:programmed cell death protein 5
MSDRDLDIIRKKRMQELLYQQQNQMQEQQIKEQQEAQVNALIKKVLTQILTPNARERLANIRLARPQQAREIELVLIQLHQQGRMQKQLSDEEFKDLLSNLSKRKKDIKIKKR